MTPFEQFMETVPKKDWNIHDLSRCSSISFEFIEKYSYLYWDWDYISMNKKRITKDIILKFEHKWNWVSLSKNKCVTLDTIEELIDKPWSW